MVKEGITMDFAVHDHADERTTAAITSLVEILGHISNALGTGIDFTEAPITKKPTSKKIDIDGDMHTDNTSLGNKSIPGMASKKREITMKKSINPLNNTSKDFTGSSLSKEDIDEVVEENMAEHASAEKIAYGLGALAGKGLVASKVNDAVDDEENMEYKMNPLSTSDGKALLATLEDATKALEKFLSTTKVSNKNALMSQDRKNELQ